MKLLSLVVGWVALLLAAGCARKAPEISELQRKQAANLASEAQFAVTLRDHARAEPLWAKAAELAPDVGEYWVSLGVSRVRLGNKAGAKSAYEEGRSVYREAFKANPENTDAVLQEVYLLALLGRTEEAMKTLERARKQAPDNRALKLFTQNRQLEQILADPAFKEIAL